MNNIQEAWTKQYNDEKNNVSKLKLDNEYLKRQLDTYEQAWNIEHETVMLLRSERDMLYDALYDLVPCVYIDEWPVEIDKAKSALKNTNCKGSL
jgi:hypothetical protein